MYYNEKLNRSNLINLNKISKNVLSNHLSLERKESINIYLRMRNADNPEAR